MDGGRRDHVEVFTWAGELLTVARLLDTFWKRFIGLGFAQLQKETLPVILWPCRSVHTFFMKYPVDLFFISQGGTVLKIVRNVPSKKIFFPVKGAKLVLEVPSDTYHLPDIESVTIPNLIEKFP